MTINIKLALKESKSYFFYAKDTENRTVKLHFEDKKKSNLSVGTVVDVICEKQGIGDEDYIFISLVSEKISDGRDKVVEEFGNYKIGDAFDNTVVFGVGSAFIKSGKKVQYLYFK